MRNIILLRNLSIEITRHRINVQSCRSVALYASVGMRPTATVENKAKIIGGKFYIKIYKDYKKYEKQWLLASFKDTA
jgi:hypothetical protein